MTEWNDDLNILNLDDLLREEEPAGEPAEDRAGHDADAYDSSPEPGAKTSGTSRAASPATPPSSGKSPGPTGETGFLPVEFIDLDEPVEEDAAEDAAEDDGMIPAEDFFSEAGKTQEKPSRSRRSAGPQTRRTLPLHLILPIVIVAVAAVAFIRLAIWNRGVDLDIDAESNANRFNVEVNDSMVTLSSSDLEGAVDDGITTVLCLGNEPFCADTSDTGLAAQIAALGDCEVINAAFPDSQVTCEHETYTTDTLEDMDDIFNLFYVAYAIAIDDYTSLETVASVHDDTYIQAVEALQNTDFSTVDIIAIMYDGIDYTEGMSMQNPDVPEELTTYVGSLYNAIILLREAYPHIRIVFLSPYYAEYDTGSARTTDLGNGTLVDYFQWAYDTCGSEGISFLDNYYGSVNENNFEEYLNEDMSLNADGMLKIADHFVYKVIEGNYSEYNPEELLAGQ